MTFVERWARASWSTRIALAWVFGDVVVVGMHTLNLWLFPTFGGPFDLFDLEHEANIPSWFSSIQISFIAWIWIGLADVLRRPAADRPADRRAATGAIIVAAALLAVSMDEIAGIHERIAGRTLIAPFQNTGLWVVILVPLAVVIAAVAGLLLRALWQRHRRVARILAIGVFAYVGGAAGVELLLNVIPPSLFNAEVFLEEGGELYAATLVLWASLRLLFAERRQTA